MILDSINNPSDLKKLNIVECELLADEIRSLIIKKASKVGGHLASNLGMVEATIALHYVFDSPDDKFIFDVSHQCYTHKILTGRKNAFINAENYNDICGYTNPDESEHDIFRIGHTATSISIACGLAKARDILGGSENIIAIIGDGSLSGGEALEGLNFGGSEIKGNLIVFFNDNQMSIAENHGGFYDNLKKLRDSNGTCHDNIFKTFGYDYYYVKNGNNIGEIIEVLKKVKGINHPVVVHANTKKGYGYSYAELNSESAHWVRPFDMETGRELKPFNGERYDRIVRDFILEKIKIDKSVIAMIAAVPDSLNYSKQYRLMAGDNFVDVGIAEEHAISMAAGLAKRGCKPIFATLSTFYQRTYDQVYQELCINKVPVTMIVVNASVYAPNDVTHIGIFDIPLLANIPNLVYLAPTNRQEYISMLDWSINQDLYPVAIRAPRNGIFETKYDVDKDYSVLNRFYMVNKGEKIAVIALGDFFQLGEEVVERINKVLEINATLINPRYITGIDEQMLENLKINHNVVVTLEDGILDGGFGQKISAFYGDSDMKVLNFGLKKEFIDRYNVDEILSQNNLKPELIIDKIKSVY